MPSCMIIDPVLFFFFIRRRITFSFSYRRFIGVSSTEWRRRRTRSRRATHCTSTGACCRNTTSPWVGRSVFGSSRSLCRAARSPTFRSGCVSASRSTSGPAITWTCSTVWWVPSRLSAASCGGASRRSRCPAPRAWPWDPAYRRLPSDRPASAASRWEENDWNDIELRQQTTPTKVMHAYFRFSAWCLRRVWPVPLFIVYLLRTVSSSSRITLTIEVFTLIVEQSCRRRFWTRVITLGDWYFRWSVCCLMCVRVLPRDGTGSGFLSRDLTRPDPVPPPVLPVHMTAVQSYFPSGCRLSIWSCT